MPDDYFLPRSWINVEGFKDSKPVMSEADTCCLGVIAKATTDKTCFDDLMSEASLIKVGLLPHKSSSRGRVDGSLRDSSFMASEGGIRMMESELQVANKKLQYFLKRDHSIGEGAVFPEYHSPPLTPGTTTYDGDEVFRPPTTSVNIRVGTTDGGSASWFEPPHLLDLSYSYFNDAEWSSKLAANIVTPADANLLGSFEFEKYRASLLDYTSKVMTSTFFSLPF